MTATTKPTADWERVGDRYYRKVQLYASVFDQDLELENYIVTGAPYGGAIAIYRDEEKLQFSRGTQSVKPSVDIYSCSGSLIRRINWERGSIRGVGWSEDEQLLIVTADGNVRCYRDLHGDYTPFSLGATAEDYGVTACRFWSSGLVALLGNNQLVSVSNYDEPRPKVLADVPTDAVISWSLIPPTQSLSMSVEVFLAINKTIYVVDANDCEDRGVEAGPFKHVSVSENGRFVALFTDDNKVWVISSDFQNKLSEYDTKVKTPPQDMQWCGNNAVVLAWEDEIHLLGPNGAASKFYYDSPVHLLPDIDGLRILTNDLCEFLQKVPDVTEDVFKPGSTSPAAILVEASDALDKQSPKADDNIQLIRGNLDDAVDTCIKAAGQEFSISLQKTLLRAASYGKSVLDMYNSDDFVDMTEILRVLNAVRHYKVALALSYEEFTRLGPEKLLQRLMNRHEYLLTLRIADYLRLPTEPIYVHWATQKVKLGEDDEDRILSTILHKLDGKRGISFEGIAKAAYDEGRGRLATQLLDHEPRAGRQVPLLLSMEEDTVALDKAIQSGDTDLMFHVLLQLRKKMPLATFLRTINSHPVASALVEATAIDQDRELLKDMYYQDDRRLEGSNLLVLEAIEQTDRTAMIDKLKSAARLLQDSKDLNFQSKAIDEAQRLLRLQESMEKDLENDSYHGISLHDTIYKLIQHGHSKRAQRLQSDFKVAEKQYWWIRLRALVASRNWHELEEVSKLKKSPIGFEPFYSDILAAGNARLASTFIPKCTGLQLQDRVEMWLKCGMVTQAGEEALRAKDLNTLEILKTKASGSSAIDIDRMIAQLRKR